MALHRLTYIVMGVPNVEETAAYYTEFGLIPTDGLPRPGGAKAAGPGGRRIFATVDGGRQLAIVGSDRRRLMLLGIGVDDPDDVDREIGRAHV